MITGHDLSAGHFCNTFSLKIAAYILQAKLQVISLSTNFLILSAHS